MAELPEQQLALLPRYRQLLSQLLRQHLPQAEIWAYGSRVTQQHHDSSDLDLVVRQPAALDRETPQLWCAKEALVESNLPIRVEMVDWARIPQDFRDEITRAYVVLQAGDGQLTVAHKV